MSWRERLKNTLAGLASAIIWGIVVAWLLAWVAAIDVMLDVLERSQKDG